MELPETAQFRDQTFRLLSKTDAAAVKTALNRFIARQDVDVLVAELMLPLNTVEKAEMLNTIAKFLPAKHRLRFLSECNTGFGDSGDDQDYVDDSVPFALPPSATHDDGSGGIRAGGIRGSTTARPTSMIGIPRNSRGSSQPAVAIGRPQSLYQTRGGMIDSSETSGRPLSSVESMYSPSTAAMALLGESAVPMTEFMIGQVSRKQAEDILYTNGMRTGSYLMRISSKGGNDATYVLSYVTSSSRVSHQIVVQSRPGEFFTVGGTQAGRATSLEGVIGHLKCDPEYYLTQPVFQAQSWYHDRISRQIAEQRLMSVCVSGRFLVRKSIREANSYVVSFIVDGHPSHKTTVLRENSWYLGTDMDRPASSLYEILLSLPVTQPCSVPRQGHHSTHSR